MILPASCRHSPQCPEVLLMVENVALMLESARSKPFIVCSSSDALVQKIRLSYFIIRYFQAGSMCTGAFSLHLSSKQASNRSKAG